MNERIKNLMRSCLDHPDDTHSFMELRSMNLRSSDITNDIIDSFNPDERGMLYLMFLAWLPKAEGELALKNRIGFEPDAKCKYLITFVLSKRNENENH